MQPLRWSEFDPDDDPTPEPLEAGYLEPPRRRPPTAVGTATPRPPTPPRRPRADPEGLTLLQRRARTALAGLFTAAGTSVALATDLWSVAAAGIGVAALGVLVGYRAWRAPSVHSPRPRRRRPR